MSENSSRFIKPDFTQFESFKKGRRYWCGSVVYDPALDKTVWTFYSDAKWPFYKGEYKQDGYDSKEAYRKFMEWIP